MLINGRMMILKMSTIKEQMTTINLRMMMKVNLKMKSILHFIMNCWKWLKMRLLNKSAKLSVRRPLRSILTRVAMYRNSPSSSKPTRR